jgi:hypothetical protein
MLLAAVPSKVKASLSCSLLMPGADSFKAAFLAGCGLLSSYRFRVVFPGGGWLLGNIVAFGKLLVA